MESVRLATSTGSERVDRALERLVGGFETAFPGRVRGYYVDGSFADGTGLLTSDLDLTVVFAGGFTGDAELQAAKACAAQEAALAGIELDAAITRERELLNGVHPVFKWASLCVFGEDIRDRVPVMPLTQWTRERMHAAYWLTVKLYDRGDVTRAPLPYPDPAAEFLGYDRRTVRLPDGGEASCTRDLIRSTGWAATALIAYRAGRYVVGKRDCHTLYRALIGGPHADLLDEIYSVCRGQWRYLLPEDAAGRRQLRTICARTLAFENDFLDQYRRFLLTELTGVDGEAERAALWMLGQIPLMEAEIVAAVRALEASDDVQIGAAAQAVLSKINAVSPAHEGQT